MTKRTYITIGAALLAIVLLVMSLRVVVVEGDSMEPTLMGGDVLLVDALSWRFMPLARGELFVSQQPHNVEDTIVKRVVGLPGETLDIRDTTIYVHKGAPCAEGNEYAPCNISFGTDTAVGRGGNGSDFEMYLGPEDYFVMGDNRSQSTDSRDFGTIQSTNFVGRPFLRLWPLERFGPFSTWRSEE